MKRQIKLPKPYVKTLDGYIIKKFLGTYVFAIVLILAIIVMFDINEKLDSFMKAPVKATIFEYYLNYIPYMANQFSPLFTFIAVIFFTSKMAENSEIIAILSSGVSFRRLLLPYMASALVIASFTFVLDSYVIPPANVKRINYQNKYVKNKAIDYGVNIQLQVTPGEIAYMSRFENSSKTAYNFSLETFKDKKLVSRMVATTAVYDTLYRWSMKNYMIRNFRGMREEIKKGATLDTIIPIEPRDFLIAENDHEKMTTPELKAYIDRQKMRGVANIKSFEIEYERRFAMTGAAFILTLIGMSLSSRKVKSGMGINIGISKASLRQGVSCRSGAVLRVGRCAEDKDGAVGSSVVWLRMDMACCRLRQSFDGNQHTECRHPIEDGRAAPTVVYRRVGACLLP